MQAEIITIGDELLIGQVVDTNSAFMAQRLAERNISLYQITSVHDNADHIRQAVAEAMQRVDIVLTTGGLGPTKDDITKSVLADYFQTTLVPSPEVEAHVRALYKDRPQVLNRLTATQWLVPAACHVLENRIGSAPIMAFEKGGKWLFSMPGVPREMEVAMTEQILPFMEKHIIPLAAAHKLLHRTCVVQGIPESSLAIHLEDFENALPEGVHLAYLPTRNADGRYIIRLRLDGTDVEEAVYERYWQELNGLVWVYLFADME